MRYLYTAVLALFMLVGCSHIENITQKDDESFLLFVGNVRGTEVVIDHRQPFSLDDYGADKRKFRIEPGQHRVKVMRGGVRVVDRSVFCASHMTAEITVP
jgi:hypothetical protein